MDSTINEVGSTTSGTRVHRCWQTCRILASQYISYLQCLSQTFPRLLIIRQLSADMRVILQRRKLKHGFWSAANKSNWHYPSHGSSLRKESDPSGVGQRILSPAARVARISLPGTSVWASTSPFAIVILLFHFAPTAQCLYRLQYYTWKFSFIWRPKSHCHTSFSQNSSNEDINSFLPFTVGLWLTDKTLTRCDTPHIHVAMYLTGKSFTIWPVVWSKFVRPVCFVSFYCNGIGSDVTTVNFQRYGRFQRHYRCRH